MEVKQESMDNFHVELVKIKEENVFADSLLTNNAKTMYSESKNYRCSPLVPLNKLKEEVGEPEIHEMKSSDYFVNTSDSINIKREAADDAEYNIKIELLTEECDIPVCKTEIDIIEEPKRVVSLKNRSKKIEPFKCDICQKTFSELRKYNSHIKNHFNGKCKICNLHIDAMHKLVKHLHAHIDQRPFNCKICSREFGFRKDFHRHLLAEHKGNKEVLFECNICSLNYFRLVFLTKHLIKVHRPDFSNIEKDNELKDEFPFNCQTCQRGFNDEIKFQRHSKLHEYCETCVHCKKSFYSPTEFRSHFYSHLDEYPKCKMCSKVFGNKDKFKSHLLAEHRKLTKKSLYYCKFCSKGFERKRSVDYHLKMTHERPYKLHLKQRYFIDHCKICFQHFTTRNRLAKHLDEHLGHPPYTCVICKRGFFTKQNLQSHLRLEQSINSDEIVMKCEICGFHFFHKQVFNKHIKFEHHIFNTQTEITTYLPENDGNKFEFNIGKHFLDFGD